MIKKLLSLIFAAALLLSLCSAVAPAAGAGTGDLPFTDVPSGKWYVGAVKAAWDAGIMNGMTDDTFAPDGSVTRAQFVTILARLSCEDTAGMGKDLPFTDVKSGKFYSDALGWAVERQLVKGYPDNTFRPNDPILRRELAALIVRYLTYKDIGITDDGAVKSFADAASFPKWARADIDALRLTGLIRGDGAGNFCPASKTTRAEIATVLSRFLGKIKEMNRYDRVVVIGVDGGGAYFREAETPNMDRIFADGSVAYDVLTSIPTISAQCWGSLLHGVTPEYHRLTNSVVGRREFNPELPFPSVFRVIRDNDPSAELASFCNWTPINNGIVENGIGVYKDGGGDKALTDKICAYVAEHDPKFLFVQFDEVDGAGHNYGFGSEKQLEKISFEDENIDRIYKAYEERGFADSTLFIVTADHGGNGESHGGTTDTEKYVMFAAAGHSVAKGAARDMAIRDTAAVVLYALGYDKPSTWTARVPAGVFRNVPEERRPEYRQEYVVSHRTHESVDTPAVDELKAALGDRELRLYMPMDGGIEETAGNRETKKIAKLYFVDGYFGGGINFDDGNIIVRNTKLGGESFSVCFWMKSPSAAFAEDGVPVFGNRGALNSAAPGFVLFQQVDNMRAVIYNGDDSTEIDFVLPGDFMDGWVHVAVSVDPKEGIVKLAYDFGEFDSRNVPEGFSDLILNGAGQLVLGNDGAGAYWYNYPGTLDEFMVIDGMLTDEDLASLAAYYGVEK